MEVRGGGGGGGGGGGTFVCALELGRLGICGRDKLEERTAWSCVSLFGTAFQLLRHHPLAPFLVGKKNTLATQTSVGRRATGVQARGNPACTQFGGQRDL